MRRHMMHPYNTMHGGMRHMHPHNSQSGANGAPDWQSDEDEREENASPTEEPENNTANKPDQPELEIPAAPEEKALPPDAEAQAAKLLEEERLRMAAEMENFKKRLQREHQEQMRYASEKVLADLLPALDNLDLALQYGSKDEACRDMMTGIEMTRKQLLDAVAKSGLAVLGERGEEFNPEFHEAIGMESDPELAKGVVNRVLQRGYKLNDRLLRPAKVIVNN